MLKNKIKKICIIGAGWYGCHIGYKLIKNGHNVTIFEKNKDIFEGSSGFNQFRLHTGFHYPRSDITIKEIKNNYKRFVKEYKNYFFIPPKNIYCIAQKKSLLDFNTYLKILKSHKLLFKKIKEDSLKNIEGSINTREGVLLNKKIIIFYRNILKKRLVLNKKIKSTDTLKKKYDYIIDCTNNTLNQNNNSKVKFILTISLIYQAKKNNKTFPITIMDGKLPSLYPYCDKKNFYTLTHSKYTHIKKFSNFKDLKKYEKLVSYDQINKIKTDMEKSFKNYYYDFNKDFIYKNYFLSYKVIPNEASDKRPLFIKKNDNVISLFSAKIANIFTAEDYVIKLINKKR
tara:strand:- start:8290 stop:9315 length:1026 start_codon:yes stop_codon:yes gene_type:complete